MLLPDLCKVEACLKRHSFHARDYPKRCQAALGYIRDNREAVDRCVEALCEKETLTGDEFREILGKFVKIPEENMRAAMMQKQKTVSLEFGREITRRCMQKGIQMCCLGPSCMPVTVAKAESRDRIQLVRRHRSLFLRVQG